MSKRIITDFFEKQLSTHGNSASAVGWSERSQLRRFEVILSMTDFEGKTLVDFGCGLGHLRPHVISRFPSCNYVGIDFSPTMIEQAKKAQPDGDFRCLDLMKNPAGIVPDIIVANGVDNVETGNNEAFMRELIANLFKKARSSLIVTMLSAKSENKTGGSHYFDADEMVRYCSKLTPSLVLKDDYLPHDFALMLTHQS